MNTPIRIDFVSDISCPWCAIALSALEQALTRVSPDIRAELHFQPFELNPNMSVEGQEITEHLTQKYGSSPEELAEIRENIRQRGAALGFTFRIEGRERIYNTFDAHRLLHWAGQATTQPTGRQPALKKALLQAYFTHGQNPSSHDVLLQVVSQVGLDPAEAARILASDQYTSTVREQERRYTQAGIQSVPAIILNERTLISGGQPVDTFEAALRQAAAAMESQ